jgi:ABC-2 type transport system permease protein
MRQLWVVARREVGSFFHSNVGPAVLVAFLVAVGLFFTIIAYGYSELSLTILQSPPGPGNFVNLSESLYRPLVANMIFFLLLLMPAVTMRLFSPEYRSGRWDLIASWPVPDGVWVAGKWLAALAVAAVLVAASGVYFAAAWIKASPEPGPLVAGWSGLMLLAGALAAWGVLASSLFPQQIVAYFLAFAWSMFLFIVGGLRPYLPEWAGRICAEASFFSHFERFSRGVLDSRDIVFFVAMAAVPLTAAVAVLEARRQPARRRWRLWLPTGLAAALGVTVYLLVAATPWTADLTADRRYSLAPQTRQVLDDLPAHLAAAEPDSAGRRPADVTVYAFYQPTDPARGVVEPLLKSCAERQPAFRFEILDPERELDLVRRYSVRFARTMVVTAGDRFTTLVQPGESALINAVYRVATGRRVRVRLLTGHGEKLLDSVAISGYASFAAALEEQGYTVSTLQLSATGRVPDDGSVVVIAGPRTDPSAEELAALDAHLARGGAILALFDPPTTPGWTRWMAGMRVGLTGDVVVSAERVARAVGVSVRTASVVDGYGDHEIANSLMGLETRYPLAQALAAVGEPDSTVFGAVLVRTDALYWAETDPATKFTGRPTFEAGRDRLGPIDLAYVLEIHRNPDGGPPGRLVVFGNSEFLNNANLNLGGNRDLALNALGWLGREEDLIALRGRDLLNQPVVLDDTEKRLLGWGAMLVWPLCAGLLAVGVLLRHRRVGGPA